MHETALIILIFCIVFLVFIALREFWTWYWKINHLIKEQEKTNMLLSKLVNYQISEIPPEEVKGEVIVQNTYTGKLKGLSEEEWNDFLALYPKQKKYRRIEKE